MTEPPIDPVQDRRAKPDIAPTRQTRRDDRRAQALKANMGRRKAQAKARVAGSADTDENADNDPKDE